MFALVLTGAPGSGKTAVLEALSDQLVVEDVRHALVETEALTSAHPPLDDSQWFEPIQAVCGLYRLFDYPLLLVAVTVESGEDLRRLLAAIGADEHAVVRLEAEPETLHRRIVDREPAGWSGLDELLAASTRLSSVIAGLDGIALTLSTERQRPPVVAERIRDEFAHVLRPVSMGNDELVRSSFDAFMRGDWEALARVMDPEVEWLWYEPGDWDCHDRKDVLATLFERQREGVVTGLNAVVAVDERVFVEVTELIKSGEAAALEQILREHPALATARVGRARTLLHVVTDWPGHVPEAGAKVAALVAAGADVNARFTGPHRETPLHWAASSDDIEALDALLDAGADIEADGAVIAGGTPIADAVAFGQWNAARRLLERGARTNLWQSAALGLVNRVQAALAQTPPTQADLDNALWCAAHGGQRETAELLMDRGADPAWVGHDNLTAAQAAERSEAHELAAWLREQDTKP